MLYSNLQLVEVLNKVLAETILNYYVKENEKLVVLLPNTIIYDEVPRGFFGQEEVTQNQNVAVVR